jgi:hypothetical protein
MGALETSLALELHGEWSELTDECIGLLLAIRTGSVNTSRLIGTNLPAISENAVLRESR